MKLAAPLSGYLVMVLPVAFSFTLAYPQQFSAIQQVPWTCPTRCKCNMTLVNCTWSGLREIPTGIPRETTILDLSHNRITQLDAHKLKTLPQMRELYLRGNRVMHLPVGIWSTLPQLKLLDLSSNRIACSCPLDWLEKQFNNLHWNVSLSNKETTECGRDYRKSEQSHRLKLLKSCMVKQRRRRTPSCDGYQCHNGGTCMPGRQPVCKCDRPFEGRHCEVGPDDRQTMENDFQITVEEVTETSITISWSNPSSHRSEGRYLLEVSMVSPSTAQWFPQTSVEVSSPRYMVSGLWPGTSYKICVSVKTEDKPLLACITVATLIEATTVSSAHEQTFHVHANDDFKPPNILPKGETNPKSKGDEMHYAFISLAALFGICLLLTIALGFLYYKRVHGNVPEETGTENRQNPSENSPTTGPQAEDIVLVSRGSEIANRGSTNPAFELHAADNEPLDTDGDQNLKRSVRFSLPDHSQTASHNDIHPETVPGSNEHQKATGTYSST